MLDLLCLFDCQGLLLVRHCGVMIGVHHRLFALELPKHGSHGVLGELEFADGILKLMHTVMHLSIVLRFKHMLVLIEHRGPISQWCLFIRRSQTRICVVSSMGQ